MKTLLFYLFVFNCFMGSGQVNKNYHPSFIFRYSSNFEKGIVINKFIVHEILERNCIGVSDPVSKNAKNYLIHEKYKLDNNQIVSLDIFYDSIILYKEFLRTANKEDSLISAGELIITNEQLSIEIANSRDQNNEDSIVFDTLYNVVQNGLWSSNLDTKSHEIGCYKNGVKDGNWLVVNSEYFSRFNIILKSIDFENGVIKNETNVNYLKELNQIKQKIKGKWFNVGFNTANSYRCKTSKCSFLFVRDESKVSSFIRDIYSFLNIFDNNIFESRIFHICGTRPLPASKKETKWSVSEDLDLILDDVIWKIEFMNENILLISRD